ncbi:Cytochrome P450, E-class, group I [Heracleum sosnowskyi]|uniref:Cytochrome P450, E-class, group I n=1 Tax=Heracleum sosnowskyi TaxID=360622 RepID=A0AAD8J0U9_9APIA|nr:Cytochrome P450, E-class, group I [Heracleum sosnowskyi]
MAFFFVIILLTLASLKFVYSIIWVPWRIQQFFRKQGVKGPNYRPFYGNTAEMIRMTKEAQSKSIPFNHDIVHRVSPDYYQWSAKYGQTFLCWFGAKPRLVLVDPDMIKEVLLHTTDTNDRDDFNPLSRPLFGQGLPGLMGHKWAAHRKIITPAFSMEKVKAWVPGMVFSVKKMLDNWEEQIGERDEFEVEVHEEFHDLSAEILSKTALGSNFEEGKRIFDVQQQQEILTHQAMHNVYIPGFRFLPNKMNILRWRLEKETREIMRRIIEINRRTSENSMNFLSMLMSGKMNKHGPGLEIEEVIDECKTFFYGGKEATANALTWAVLLLAQHQEWQNKAREEVLRVCKGNELPSAEKLPELKIVDMIIKETLRLYAPDNSISRRTLKNVKVGSLNIPAETEFYIPQAAVHHDTKIWGLDANQFNPARFVEPPKQMGAYFPFGIGSRICIGRNLAMVEAKIVLAMIIKQFSFVVSPSYVHAPMMLVTVQPQYGAQVLVRRINY